MSFPAYETYKDSGVEWLGRVPSHWEIKCLKHVADIRLSNVDKHTIEGEESVHLCNYVDVYRNEKITEGMDFMRATASPEQIGRLSLQAGDCIITKDSEDPGDIGVPAYVPTDVPGIVCGYHLAILRPFPTNANGLFLHYVCKAETTKAAFEVGSRGLTRYALGKYAIDNFATAFPSVREQSSIAAFLDRETGKIDALVEEQTRLIELLKEKRQAVISHAVTKGLDPNAPMKDSGVEWLGEVPAHWNVKPLKHVGSFKGGAGFPDNEQGVEGEELPFYKVNALARADSDGYLIPDENTISADTAARLRAFIFQPDTIIFAKIGAALLLGRIRKLREPACIDNNLMGFEVSTPNSVRFIEYLMGLLKFDLIVNPGAVPSLNQSQIETVAFAFPSTNEQSSIATFLDSETARLGALIDEAQSAIALLQERRSALISAAVTGKIDVRNSTASQSEAA